MPRDNEVRLILRGVDQISRTVGQINRSLNTLQQQSRRSAKGIGEVQKSTQGLNRSMIALQRSALRAAGALGVAFSARAAAQGATNMIDTMTLMESRVRLVTKSTAELNTVMDELFDISQETRTGLQPTVDLYARIARSSADLGLNQRQLVDTTELINKTLQISGATAAEASAGVIQFGQGLAFGKLRGDELRSVMEQLPGLAQAIADGLELPGREAGVTRREITKLGQEGKLTAIDILRAINKMADGIDSDFSKIQPTIAQMFLILNNSLTVAVSRIDKMAGASAELKRQLRNLAIAIDDISGALVGQLRATDELGPKTLVLARGFILLTNQARILWAIFEGISLAFVDLIGIVASFVAVIVGAIPALVGFFGLAEAGAAGAASNAADMATRWGNAADAIKKSSADARDALIQLDDATARTAGADLGPAGEIQKVLFDEDTLANQRKFIKDLEEQTQVLGGQAAAVGNSSRALEIFSLQLEAINEAGLGGKAFIQQSKEARKAIERVVDAGINLDKTKFFQSLLDDVNRAGAEFEDFGDGAAASLEVLEGQLAATAIGGKEFADEVTPLLEQLAAVNRQTRELDFSAGLQDQIAVLEIQLETFGKVSDEAEAYTMALEAAGAAGFAFAESQLPAIKEFLKLQRQLEGKKFAEGLTSQLALAGAELAMVGRHGGDAAREMEILRFNTQAVALLGAEAAKQYEGMFETLAQINQQNAQSDFTTGLADQIASLGLQIATVGEGEAAMMQYNLMMQAAAVGNAEFVESIAPLIEQVIALTQTLKTSTTIENLEKEVALIGLANRDRFIALELQKLGNDATDAQIAKVRELAGALYESREAWEIISNAADQAARNIQSALADFIFDPFEDGLDGMLEGFLDVVRRMIAEIAASNLLRLIFGSGGPFGWLVTGASAAAGAAAGGASASPSLGGFAPKLQHGGPVSAGKIFQVEEPGNPEIFLPAQRGTVVPLPRAAAMGKLGGQATYAPVTNIEVSGSVTPDQLEFIIRRNNEVQFARFQQWMRDG